MTSRYAFLAGVLGEDGARALEEAAARSHELRAALLPRTIMAWLGVVAKSDFEGQLPGLPNSYFSLTKTEGPGFSGVIGVDSNSEQTLVFENTNLIHVAASVAVALEADAEPIDPSLRDIDVARLGKNIDLLAKARSVVEKLDADEDEEDIEKVEPAGPIVAPKKQGAAQAPTEPVKQPQLPPQAKKPAKTDKPAPAPRAKVPPIRLSKSQAETPCDVCGLKQAAGEQLRFCLCWRDLRKATKVVADAEGFTLEFGSDWDAAALATFLRSLPSGD